jgi:anion-transporting  ArsA/GET3 family ATPase
MTPLGKLLETRSIVVSAGPGGVGKTTTATAMALVAARLGRRVLVLTVDPSKRLAEVLGVAMQLPAPVAVPEERLAAAGLSGASVETWMLDPMRVAETALSRIARSPEELAKLRQNRVYREIARMVAGMQEYAAMEALHGFYTEGRYDIVVLDTPPSRHALDFLEGPERLSHFLDARVFKVFQGGGGFFQRSASRVVARALDAAFGPANRADLFDFFGAFADVFDRVGKNAGSMHDILANRSKTGFVVVTSPAADAVAEARSFRAALGESALPFEGYVLNRGRAFGPRKAMPSSSTFGTDAVGARAFEKLERLARLEEAERNRDETLLAGLTSEVGTGGFVMPTPFFSEGAQEMHALARLATALETGA